MELLLTSLAADEGSLRRLWDPLPHPDGFGVPWIRSSLLLVVAPVPVPLEEVRFPDAVPTKRSVDTVFGEEAAQLHQTLRVTRLGRDLPKHPELVP